MDVTKNCIICKKTLSVGSLKTVKTKGIQSLSVCSRKYGDKNWELLENKSQIVLHQLCNLHYSTGVKKNPEVVDSPASRRSSRSSAIDSFDFSTLCIFCQKDWGRSQSTNYVVSKDLTKEKLIEIARNRNDQLGISVICLIDAIPSLVEVNARYHKDCFDKFKYILKPSTNTPDAAVKKTMQKIYNYIENHDECQFTISELRTIGNNKLCDKTILKYLKIRYNDDVTIVTRARKDTVICYSGIGTLPVDEYWYLHQEEKKEDERLRIVKTAAELVRKQIKSTSYDYKMYPSSTNFLENVETDVPKYLDAFLSVVMLDRFAKISSNESISIETLAGDHPGQGRNSAEEFASYDNSGKKMKVKKNYLAHSIISAIRPKSFVSTFHHATGLYINRKSGSKLIVNLLSNLGVCASYYDVALHEMSAIKAEVTTITPPVFGQYVYDNADHNAQTLDGKNTIHVAAGIVALHPPSALGTGNPVPKLTKLPHATEVASFGNVPLKDYIDHGTSLKSIEYEDVQQYKFGNIVAGLTPVYTTYLWGRHLKVWELPSARGFLEKVSQDVQCHVSRVLLLPIIDQNPSNLQTIYTALHYASNHAKKLKMKTCFVTFDYALSIKAKQIICNTPDKDLKAVQLRLGGFHLLMSYLKAVGTIMGGSGIKELFGTVFALNSVDKMLGCTSYSRAIRGHILAATAIGELIAQAASTAENINSHSEIQGIKSFDSRRALPSVMDIQRIINAKSSKLTDFLKDFKDNPPTSNVIENDNDCKDMYHLFLSAVSTLKRRGPTAELWIQYFHMIMTALQFIDAERNENWNLHLLCVREMLPVFHAAGHFNYIKGAQIYLQDMEKLKNEMDVDEYMAFTDKGLFTIRRTEKPWSGVWSDMTIEQTAMGLARKERSMVEQ